MRYVSIALIAFSFAAPVFAQTTGSSTIGTQITAGTNHEHMTVSLVAIDGTEIDSGSSMWSDDENLTYPLSPGAHTLTLHVVTGLAKGKQEAVIFATPGQHFQLGAETVVNPLTKEPDSYIAWVQDSTGARVWTQQFTVTTTLNYQASPWQH